MQLRKLANALNPFHRPAKTVKAEPAVPPKTHPHSFSCPCIHCDAETLRLTAERLKRQGA